LGTRFKNEVLSNPKSFTRRDFDSLLSQYNDVLRSLRAYTPEPSQPSTPRTRASRPIANPPTPPPQRPYWNEYDDGSEAENEPYTIFVDPDAESTFPGARTVAYVISRAKLPMEKVKAWLSPEASPEERQHLIADANYFAESPNATETDVEDEAYASSSDFPVGYATHYASFPSISDQRLYQYRERLLFRSTIGSFIAASLLLVIAAILVATGKHRLRIEVDAGVIVGVVASLFFATLGFGTMLYRKERVGWVHRTCVGLAFVIVCVVNGMLLVLVAGTGL